MPLEFKAFINNYSENYSSNWNDIKYNGRSELFYVFNSYKKTAGFKLQIPAFKKSEIEDQHNKLKNIPKILETPYDHFTDYKNDLKILSDLF